MGLSKQHVNALKRGYGVHVPEDHPDFGEPDWTEDASKAAEKLSKENTRVTVFKHPGKPHSIGIDSTSFDHAQRAMYTLASSGHEFHPDSKITLSVPDHTREGTHSNFMSASSLRDFGSKPSWATWESEMSTMYSLTPEVAAILEGQDIDEVLGFLARMALGHVVNAGVNKALPAVQSAFQDAIAYEPTSTSDAAKQMDKLAKLAFHPSSKGTPEGKLAYTRLAKIGQKHGIDHKDFLQNPKKYLEPDRKVDIGQTASNLAAKAGLSPIKKSTWSDTMAAFKQGMGESQDKCYSCGKPASNYVKPIDAFVCDNCHDSVLHDLNQVSKDDKARTKQSTDEKFENPRECPKCGSPARIVASDKGPRGATKEQALQCDSCGTSFTTKPRTRESSYSVQGEIPLKEGRGGGMTSTIRRMMKIQEDSEETASPIKLRDAARMSTQAYRLRSSGWQSLNKLDYIPKDLKDYHKSGHHVMTRQVDTESMRVRDHYVVLNHKGEIVHRTQGASYM